MTLKIEIDDGKGKGNRAEVDKENHLLTISPNIPPINGESSTKIYASYFKDVNAASSMIVNGSTINQYFYINAANNADRYIKTVSFLIVDSGASLNKFGNFTALTNGCKFYYQDSKLGDVIINDSLKSNWDFMRMSQGSPPIGGGTSAYQSSNIISTSEGYMAVVDFAKIFGLPWGVRIPKNSELKLVIQIRDAIPAVDEFTAIAYGFDRII